MRNGKPHYWDAVHVTSELIGRNSLQSIWTLMNKEMDSEESSYKRSSGQVSLCRQVRQSRDHFKVGISSHFTFGPNTISQEKRTNKELSQSQERVSTVLGTGEKKRGNYFCPFQERNICVKFFSCRLLASSRKGRGRRLQSEKRDGASTWQDFGRPSDSQVSHSALPLL